MSLIRLPAFGGRIRGNRASDQPNVRRMAGSPQCLTSLLKKGIEMKRLVLTTALVLISASAYAGTYNFQGVTVSVQDGCRSASCVAVNAPGYGSYNGKALSATRSAKTHKLHKDETRFASTAKTDAAPVATAPATDAAPAKLPEPVSETTASTSAPAK
jgi:hypothetical protein